MNDNLPPKLNFINRILYRIKLYYAQNLIDYILVIRLRKSGNLEYDLKPILHGCVHYEDSSYDVESVYRTEGKHTMLVVEGVRKPVDLKAYPEMVASGKKFTISDKECFNKMNNRDVAEMIKAVKDSQYKDLALYGAAGLSLVAVLYLSGSIHSGMMTGVENMLTSITSTLNDVTVLQNQPQNTPNPYYAPSPGGD